MIVTLDTNVIINACSGSSWDHIDVLSIMRTHLHTLALDYDGRILKEYRQNCSGIELFEKWFAEVWQRVQQVSGDLDNRHVAQLTRLGCHEHSDHIFIAVAHKTDRYLVTEDSDMAKGNIVRALANVGVAKYLRDSMNLTVHDAGEARAHLTGAAS